MDEAAMQPVNEVDAAPPAEADGDDLDTKVRKWQAERDRRYLAIRHDARAVWRAMEKWESVRTPEQWQERVEQAREDYASGKFLIDQLGSEHYLDPDETAVYWTLRQRLLDQVPHGGAAEEMLADLALLNYRNALRVQQWIGNAAMYIEHELWGQDNPTAKFKEKHGYSVDGLRVEAIVERLVHELVPLLDRCSRSVSRSLKAMRELSAAPAPAVAIAQA
ncbi:MAG TPA: hypothetical protein VFA70_09280, partial [Dehalococcoidia bacterium]|nr:hypothetical protein [Dehalococcoidia bacterium]